ncbi:DUF2165 family protein [Symbiopectobacterium sp. Eva_TO]
MYIRLSKSILVCAIAFFASLVAFGNITDYSTNLEFVRHVFMMDTIYPDSSIHYRAINSPRVHQLGYIFIIFIETFTAVLCWIGGVKLFLSIKADSRVFNYSKKTAVLGLTLGFLLWQVGFMSIGGEWFGMWMSSQWNGVPDAFHFFVTIILVLIYLIQPDT